MENRLKELRKNRQITQAELAEKSGISRVTINKLENGKLDNIGTKTLADICDALDCNIVDFFCANR